MVAVPSDRSNDGAPGSWRARAASYAKSTGRRALRRLIVRNVIHLGGAVARMNPYASPVRHGVRVERNIGYGSSGTSSHRLDVFRPEGARAPLPTIFYVHGGGFSMLSKETHWGMAMSFARRGYLVVNINYRLAPKHPFPEPLEDVCNAYGWALDHAESFGGDLDRLILAGESAGANLVTALTIATCFERPEPFARRVFERGVRPSAVVPACGILQVTDTDRFSRRKELPRWVKNMLSDVSRGYLGDSDRLPSPEIALADPLVILESDEASAYPLPPFFVPVGTRDPLLDDTRRLEQALHRRGAHCVARFYPGEIHAFHALIWREQARECWEEKFAFLESVLAAGAPAPLPPRVAL